MADKKPEKKETSTEAVKKVDKKLPFFKRIGKWFRDMKSEAQKSRVADAEADWQTTPRFAWWSCSRPHLCCGASILWPTRACSFF